MESAITLSSEAVYQAVKYYIERQGYEVIRFSPPEIDPMRRLSDPGSIGVVVRPKAVSSGSCYEQESQRS